MANQKVTDLTAQTSVNLTDTYHVVNTSDTSQDASGSSYKITWATLRAAILALFTAGTGITFSGGVIASDPTATQTLSNKTLTSPIVNVGSDATGDLLVRSATGILQRVAPGSVGTILTSGGAGVVPSFAAPLSTPSGAISMYGGSTAPTGWLLCDGSAVSRTTYANLFAVLSTTYGSGNGSTTFNLPNLKGSVPVGYDASQSEFNALGKTGGEKTHTLTTTEMPSHSHGLNISTGSTGGGAFGGPTNINPPVVAVNTNNTGGDGPHNNLQPYLALNFIIAI